MTKRKVIALIERSRAHGNPVTVRNPGLTLIRRMAAEGQDLVTIGKALGVSPKTLRKLRDDVEAVGEAFQLGHAILADELTHILLQQARKGNTVAAIFLSKARLFWSDRHDPTGEAVKPAIVINLPSAMTPEQWEKMTRDAAPALEIEHAPDIIEKFHGKVIR